MTNKRGSKIKAKSSAAREGVTGPAIVLIEPQLGENIGMVARAMLNCGLTDLRLVRPRDGWPNLQAEKCAAGADLVIDNTRIFETTKNSIADLNLIYATTARDRDMIKDIVTPAKAAEEIRKLGSAGCGILFGCESNGINNEDIALAKKIVITPLNPGFTSLNLAQAVLLIAYEWYKICDTTPPSALRMKNTRLANSDEMLGLFDHLEGKLDKTGFLKIPEKKPIMVQNIRNVLQRANMTEQEVRTFRGIITSLTKNVD